MTDKFSRPAQAEKLRRRIEKCMAEVGVPRGERRAYAREVAAYAAKLGPRIGGAPLHLIATEMPDGSITFGVAYSRAGLTGNQLDIAETMQAEQLAGFPECERRHLPRFVLGPAQ